MKQLPDSPHLFHLKKQAKDLLRSYELNDPAAIRRLIEFLPSARGADPGALATRPLRLHDAQSCIAREYGFTSWAELKAYVESKAASESSGESAVRAWLSLVYGEGYQNPRPTLALRLLQERQALLGDDPYLACAIGDEERLRRELENNPDWVNQAGGVLQMPPLIAVTHSGMIRVAEHADALERCAKLLLEYDADPNQTWINPAFPESPLSALYGAAGKNHHAGMTRLLLASGADPNDNESLYHSMESADLTCARLLLEAGARVEGTNALAHVLDYDKLDGLKLLLAYCKNPDESGSVQVLHHAIRRGRSPEHIQLLLDAGIDPHAKAHGITPYRFALLYGLPEVAALLRQSGIDEPLSEEEAFLAACARGDREEALKQLAKTPYLIQNLSAQQLQQLPNLAAQGNLAAVKVMVEAGWPIAVRGGDWSASALNLAIFCGNAEMTEFLLEHGASWEERHGFNNNAIGTLSYASKNNSEEIESGDWLACAKALIAHGMPLPPDGYEFSEEIGEYFSGLRDGGGLV